LIFLLGAGASHPEMPSTQIITQNVVTGEGIARHTNSHYYFSKPLCGRNHDDAVERVVKLINIVRTICDSYYANDGNRETDYEDIFYLLSQLLDNERGEYDNPAIQPLAELLMKEIEPLLLPSKDAEGFSPTWTDFSLLSEAASYITDVSYELLKRQPIDLRKHLKFLKDATNEGHDVSIFTLNHDVIIEDALNASGIKYCDGFIRQEDDLYFWRPDILSANSSVLKLFKLHGSIDWYDVMSEDGGWHEIARFRSQNRYHISGPDGKELLAFGGPLVLMGTFNKIMKYTTGIFGELHFHFHRILKESDQMVICGYGFRDKGINQKIAEWIRSKSLRRLIVIHPDPKDLFSKARGLISSSQQSWIKEGKLQVVKATAQDVDWVRDIGSILSSNG
jgi:hypothetical protein